MTPYGVMVSHKLVGIYMIFLIILGVNTIVHVFCLFKLFLVGGKELIAYSDINGCNHGDKHIYGQLVPSTLSQSLSLSYPHKQLNPLFSEVVCGNG